VCNCKRRQHVADRFNIEVIDHRLDAAAEFEKSVVWIKWIGTHNADDNIDVKEIEHGS
jgi:mRNA interferase HigB